MTQTAPLESLTSDVANELVRTGRQLVLAESCTAGLVAASLGRIAGISNHFCGSAVVYQEQTKTAWIGVDDATLARCGAVSCETALAMTEGVLNATPHADLAAAVTGHLGPGAPDDLDGVVFIAVQTRGETAVVERFTLPPAEDSHEGLRERRQTTVTEQVLRCLLRELRLSN